MTIHEDNAEKLGRAAADAYWDEFGVSPADDGRENVGDWDSTAWELHWHELKDKGAGEQMYDACLQAWRYGFWGTTATV